MTRPSADVPWCHLLLLQFQYYSVGRCLFTGQGYPALRALTPPPPLVQQQQNKKKTYMTPSHLQKTVIFYTRILNVYASFPKANIWFQASVLQNHMCFPTARCVCCSFLAVPYQMPHPGSLTNIIKFKDVGLLNGTPRFFLHGSFCMKKRRRLFYKQI